MNSSEPSKRLAIFADRWHVTVDRLVETPSSLLGFGARGDLPVVLKIARLESDEADVGSVVAAFGGRGLVRVYEHETGAALFERLIPGTPLVELVRRDDDLAATRILAELAGALHDVVRPVAGFVTVEEWGRGFERYRNRGDRQIPTATVEEASDRYAKLCSTQGPRRLLHGDLHHYNTLADRTRGWIAVDPKGVVGELEFELAAALRNPRGVRESYATTSAVDRRIECFGERLDVDVAPVVEWAYAQAVRGRRSRVLRRSRADARGGAPAVARLGDAVVAGVASNSDITYHAHAGAFDSPAVLAPATAIRSTEP